MIVTPLKESMRWMFLADSEVQSELYRLAVEGDSSLIQVLHNHSLDGNTAIAFSKFHHFVEQFNIIKYYRHNFVDSNVL